MKSSQDMASAVYSFIVRNQHTLLRLLLNNGLVVPCTVEGVEVTMSREHTELHTMVGFPTVLPVGPPCATFRMTVRAAGLPQSVLFSKRLGLLTKEQVWAGWSCVVSNVAANYTLFTRPGADGEYTVSFSLDNGPCEGSPLRLLVYDYHDIVCDELVDELFVLPHTQKGTFTNTGDRPGYSGRTLMLQADEVPDWRESLNFWTHGREQA